MSFLFTTINIEVVAFGHRFFYCTAPSIVSWQEGNSLYIVLDIEAVVAKAALLRPPNEENFMELQTRLQILAIAMSFGFVAAVVLGMV